MTRPTLTAWVKRLALAGAVVCLGGLTTAKPADAQISLQLPFVSLGVGYPSYYYPYYYYGYPYYHRAYWGWRHRCHWWHHHCHYY